MTTELLQAIIRTSYTVSATFTGKPTDEQRAALKQSGAIFKNGTWVRNQSDTHLVEPDRAIAAFTA